MFPTTAKTLVSPGAHMRVLHARHVFIAALSLIAFAVLSMTSASRGTNQQFAERALLYDNNGDLAQSIKQVVPAVGSNIIVNSTADVVNSTDGLCTLREAITAANTNTASGAIAGECVAGSGSDSDTLDLTTLTGAI